MVASLQKLVFVLTCALIVFFVVPSVSQDCQVCDGLSDEQCSDTLLNLTSICVSDLNCATGEACIRCNSNSFGNFSSVGFGFCQNSTFCTPQTCGLEDVFAYIEEGITCPSGSSVVSSTGNEEREWVSNRHKKISQSFETLFGSAPAEVPTLGIACSGGGYRALTSCSGTLQSFTEASFPIYDLATYITGLSGGGWYADSLTFSPNPQSYFQHTVNSLNALWEGVISGRVQGWFNAARALQKIRNEHAGTPYDIASGEFILVWGSGITNHTADMPATSLRLSGIQDIPSFTNWDIPFPIITAVMKNGTREAPQDYYQFEFGPYQIGSITPQRFGWIDSANFGTQFTNGIPTNNRCWRGDTLYYILGISGSAFEQSWGEIKQFARSYCAAEFSNRIERDICDFVLADLVIDVLRDLSPCGNTDRDFPCPALTNNFMRDYNMISDNYLRSLNELTLIDGGNGGNLPMAPLLIRKQQYIISLDNSLDSGVGIRSGVPTGEALLATQAYARKYNLDFPTIPTNSSHPTQMPSSFIQKIVVFNACRQRRSPFSVTPTIFYVPLLANSAWNDPYLNTVSSTLEGMTPQQVNLMMENRVAAFSNPLVRDYFLCVIRNQVDCNCPSTVGVVCTDINARMINNCTLLDAESPAVSYHPEIYSSYFVTLIIFLSLNLFL